jgi:hypothetical protein
LAVPKLFCPSCMKPVTVPDDFAGREVTCPSCGKVFDAPAKYTPTVLGEVAPLPTPSPPPAPEPTPMTPDVTAERTAPPPGFVPPIPTTPAAVSVAPDAPPMPAGYTRARGLAFNPRVIAWLPAILLVVTLLATFGPWVGMYLGGYPVYSQGPWSAMVGAVNPNLEFAQRMEASGAWVDKVTSDWELMVPFLLALLLATVLALAERGFTRLDPRRIPPLAGVWKYRQLLIVVLATLAFALVLIHVINGFGMERAIRQTVSEQFAAERAAAKGSRAAEATVQYKQEQAIAKYNLERTSFFYIGLAANLLAVLAMLAHLRLERRGDKPPPRLVIQY